MKYLKIILFLFTFFQIKESNSQISLYTNPTYKKKSPIKGLQDWDYISENKIGVKFYLRNPVGRDKNNNYTFWVLMFYSNPKYPSELYGSTHIEQVMVLNVSSKKWYAKRIVIFDKEEKVMQIHDYLPDWQDIVPNSFADIMLTHFLISKI